MTKEEISQKIINCISGYTFDVEYASEHLPLHDAWEEMYIFDHTKDHSCMDINDRLIQGLVDLFLELRTEIEINEERKKNCYFPILLKYLDGNEECVVYSPKDIQNNRNFEILMYSNT